MLQEEKINNTQDFSEKFSHLQRSALQNTLIELRNPENLSFGLGLPNTKLFPSESFSKIGQELLNERKYFQYESPSLDLKKMIVKIMEKRGVECNENQILLTHGAQQGVSLLVNLLLSNQGTVVSEEIIFTEFLQTIKPYNTKLISVPSTDAEGIDVDALEDLLSNGLQPSLLYTISNGHNPLGINLSFEKKKKLALLAKKYSFPIIEDDPYGFLNYDGTDHSPLRSFENDWIFYVGSFSKILAPSLRTGWVVAPENIIDKLDILKDSSDLNTSTLSQHLISKYLKENDIFEHIDKINEEYSALRNTMVRAINSHFPSSIEFEIPSNGMFIWVRLPNEVNSLDLLKLTLSEVKVAFLPGEVFCATNPLIAKNCIRLNFTNFSHDQIETGIELLGSTIKKYIKDLKSL
ncbi:PLP-dependent aminotransferase family protein [Psychrobacillus glaciei]|uniref:PLP-dependent aminotransferase family protein n=1 Tax=Psychrobacillus glaciei TaxID=2283160 RepID=A0A5J6SR00_9BACI|nr:PLP-dependent aminotransferase family protein [Psychrobacillus glaciei]QFG00396.1 PLP-dependent aminotransferase family protein [Psychrobacillus glaciei]